MPDFIGPDGMSFRPKARLLIDASTTDGSRYDARNISGTEVRMLRLGFEGAVNPHLAYVMEVDFADSNAAVKSAYVAWRDNWRGTDVEFTLGNRLSERSIDGSSSTDALPFMERNAVASALAPLKGFYGVGVIGKAFGPGWHLAAQVAGDEIANPGDARDTVTYLARGHWNPIRSSTAIAHVGAWGFYEEYSSGLTSLTRNSLWGGHFNDNVQVPLGVLPGPGNGAGYGAELGGAIGPRWVLGEAGRREISTLAGRVHVDAWAVTAGWLITGEASPYSARSGAFGRIRPNQPLSKGGLGSFELVARYQQLDNSDAPLGGKGQEATIGLNWRLEEWMRLMFNLSHWEVVHRSGAFNGSDSGDTLAGRMQLTF
jgi:phosphate-selective porin OprO/OprP